MKKLVFIFLISLSSYSYGQGTFVNLSKSQLINFLKNETVGDTIKFTKSDVIKTEHGILNMNSYSRLIVINGEYLFKPDIIEPYYIDDLVNEIFDKNKIKRISVIEDPTVLSMFDGENVRNGIVLITLKKGINLSPKILALQLNGGLVIPPSEQVLNSRVDKYLVIDDFAIQLKDGYIESINPRWIKKMMIVKDGKYKYIYGNMSGKIYIYPKEEFRERLLKY